MQLERDKFNWERTFRIKINCIKEKDNIVLFKYIHVYTYIHETVKQKISSWFDGEIF